LWMPVAWQERGLAAAPPICTDTQAAHQGAELLRAAIEPWLTAGWPSVGHCLLDTYDVAWEAAYAAVRSVENGPRREWAAVALALLVGMDRGFEALVAGRPDAGGSPNPPQAGGGEHRSSLPDSSTAQTKVVERALDDEAMTDTALKLAEIWKRGD